MASLLLLLVCNIFVIQSSQHNRVDQYYAVEKRNKLELAALTEETACQHKLQKSTTKQILIVKYTLTFLFVSLLRLFDVHVVEVKD